MNINKADMIQGVHKNEHYAQALDMYECKELEDLTHMMAFIILRQQEEIEAIKQGLRSVVNYGKGRRVGDKS